MILTEKSQFLKAKYYMIKINIKILEMTELWHEGQISGCQGLEGEERRMKMVVKKGLVMMA